MTRRLSQAELQAAREAEEFFGTAAGYVTKDSGERKQFDSGMQRDTDEGKPRFDLLWPKGIAFDDQLLTRWAQLMARGASKYEDRNWEQAEGQEELDRFVSSAARHFHQWMAQRLGAAQDGEDHATAVMFNLLGAETVLTKMSDRWIDARVADDDHTEGKRAAWAAARRRLTGSTAYCGVDDQPL